MSPPSSATIRSSPMKIEEVAERLGVSVRHMRRLAVPVTCDGG